MTFDDLERMSTASLEELEHNVRVVLRERDGENGGDYEDHMSDVEAEADVLRSCGWGTDEDYGYFGEDHLD